MFQTESLVGALSCVEVSTISSRMECAYFSLEFWMKRPCIFHGTVFKVFSAATRRYIDDSKGKKSMAVGQTLSYHLGAHLALVASLSNFFFGRLRPPRKHTIRSRVLLPCWFHSFEERPLLLASPLCRLLGFPLSFSASLGLHSSRSSFPRIRFCRRQSQRPLPLQGDGGAAQNELDFFTKKTTNPLSSLSSWILTWFSFGCRRKWMYVFAHQMALTITVPSTLNFKLGLVPFYIFELIHSFIMLNHFPVRIP